MSAPSLGDHDGGEQRDAHRQQPASGLGGRQADAEHGERQPQGHPFGHRARDDEQRRGQHDRRHDPRREHVRVARAALQATLLLRGQLQGASGRVDGGDEPDDDRQHRAADE